MSRRKSAPINHASPRGLGRKLEGRLHGGKDVGYIRKDVLSGKSTDVDAYQRAEDKRQRRREKRSALMTMGGA